MVREGQHFKTTSISSSTLELRPFLLWTLNHFSMLSRRKLWRGCTSGWSPTLGVLWKLWFCTIKMDTSEDKVKVCFKNSFKIVLWDKVDFFIWKGEKEFWRLWKLFLKTFGLLQKIFLCPFKPELVQFYINFVSLSFQANKEKIYESFFRLLRIFEVVLKCWPYKTKRLSLSKY